MLYESYEYPSLYVTLIRMQTIFGLPLNGFTLYLIFRKSGQHMKVYRYYLASTQTLSSLSEIVLGTLCVDLFFPAISVVIHGLLVQQISWFPQVVVMGLLSLFGALFISILSCFVYRHQQLLEMNSRFKLSNLSILVITIVYYLVEIIPLFIIRSFLVIKVASDVEVTQMIQQFPDMGPTLKTLPTFLTIKNSPLYSFQTINAPMLLILVLGFYAILHGITVLFSIKIFQITVAIRGVILVYSSIQILTKRNEHLSEKTRKMQRTFLTSLILQTMIPTLWIALPIACLFSIVVSGIAIGQWINQFMILMFSCHGSVASIAVLCIYEPYRVYIKTKFRVFLRKIPILRDFEAKWFSKVGQQVVINVSKHTQPTGT